MSLESFFGLEDSESSGSAESAEKFREQMRKNARAIKAMSAHQKNQKKKEDKLAHILVRFIQDSSKSAAVFIIVKMLQENIPGPFILAILTLADAELEREFHEALEGPDSSSKERELINFAGDSTLPDSVKRDLNAWGESILKGGMMLPGKTLSSVLTPEHKLKSIVLDLINYALEEYFSRHNIELSAERSRQFALLCIQSVLIQLRDMAQEKTDAEIIETPIE